MRLRITWEFARLLTKAIRDIPDFLLERMNAYLERERTIQILNTVTGDKDDTRLWLYATRGDADTALELAQLGVDLMQAIDWRDQGFGADSVRHMGRALAAGLVERGDLP